MDRLNSFLGSKEFESNLMRVAKAYDAILEKADGNPAVWSLEFRDGLVELLWLARMVIDQRCLCAECEAKLQK